MMGDAESFLIVIMVIFVLCGFCYGVLKLAKHKNAQDFEKNNQDMNMLFPCPSCGHLVSNLASACPNCGRPMERTVVEKNQTNRQSSGLLIAVSVIVGIIAAVWILSKILTVEITGTIVPIK